MTNDEINKYIHVEIMGKCWHKSGLNQNGFPSQVCDHCELDAHDVDDPRAVTKTLESFKRDADYCSDDSPRRLLNEVVEKVLPTLQFENRQSIEQLRKQGAILLTAEQIARACVEAHKALKETI